MSFLPEDKHIIVAYHYVEDPRKDRAGLHPCSCKEFKRQIDFLSKNFRISSIQEVFEAAKNGNPERLCAITFDDGLKDQYVNAAPLLKKNKITAAFFIITSALDGIVPHVHKIHILLSLSDGKKLADSFNDFLAQHYPDLRENYRIRQDKRLTDKRAVFDDILTANLKETMNILPENAKRVFFDWIFGVYGYQEKNLANEIFMQEKEIIDLQSLGFCVGSHGHNHKPLDTLQKNEIKKDIALSKKKIEGLIKKTPRIFCYPSGGSSSEAVDALKEEGFTHAVTIEQRAVNSKDTPFFIPRYDTNDIKNFLNAN